MNAPVTYPTLRPSANAAALDPHLPAKLRQLLAVNNGAYPSMAAFLLPDLFYPLSADEIAKSTAIMAASSPLSARTG